MDAYYYLFMLSVILISTKFFGLVTQRVKMPQVVGALLVGVILGPSGAGILVETEVINVIAEIGVIMLMFSAGLDTDIEELKKTGKASFIIALIGVIVPLFGGILTYGIFFPSTGNSADFLRKVFVGVILTATSVSITVETLREMGKLKGKVGTTILGAAIIDDILGMILLTFITAFTDVSVKPAVVIYKIILFFVFVLVAGIAIHYIFKAMDKAYGEKRRVAIYGLSSCFMFAYLSEKLFGVADITGAYFAGLILCNIPQTKQYIDRRVSIASYMLFSPVFFASIGIKTDVGGLTGSLIAFSIVLLVVAILTKIVGCGLGALYCKYSRHEAVSVGVGMISRGEVALIVAQKGAAVGLVSPELFPPVVLVVIVTTLVTPILLKIVMSKDESSMEAIKTGTH